MTKTIEELRESPYHQQLGRKICAAFIAQQQGIALNTALRKVHQPIGDLWLTAAEFVREGYARAIDTRSLNEPHPQSGRSIM